MQRDADLPVQPLQHGGKDAAAAHLPPFGEQPMQRKASAALPALEVVGAMLRACSAPVLSPRSEDTLMPSTPAKPPQCLRRQRQPSPHSEKPETAATKDSSLSRPSSCKRLTVTEDTEAPAGLGDGSLECNSGIPARVQASSAHEHESASNASGRAFDDELSQHCGDAAADEAELRSRKETDQWLQEAFHVTATPVKALSLHGAGSLALPCTSEVLQVITAPSVLNTCSILPMLSTKV